MFFRSEKTCVELNMRLRDRRGFARQTEKSKRAHLRPRRLKQPKFHEKNQKSERRKKNVAGEKKGRHFGRLGTLSTKLQKNSSKNTFIQKHFHPKNTFIQKTLSSKTISSKREDNFIHDTFIQKRVHPMTLSSKNGFVQ